MSVGLNVPRRMIGGVGNAEVGSEARAATTSGAPPGMFRVVVKDVIYDPDSLTTQQRDLIRGTVSNPELVDNMPPNSILGRIITSGQDLSSPNPAIFYPFFSSHFALPVQPGEQVTAVFDDFAQQGMSLGRWFSRVHESSAVEDVNYTHSDRRFDNSLFPSQRRTSDPTPTPASIVPAFPNGGGTQGTFSLQPSGSINPYDAIVNNAFCTKFADYEPVPRWVKRPQETVIQGMNNSLIMIGEDRTGPATRVSGSAQRDRTPYAGTVDIVCGRGRGNIPYNPDQPAPDPTSEKTGTSPGTLENTRHKQETDKAPFRRNRRRNPNEGNPDFKRDAARLYVSMNTAGDRNLKTGHSTNAEEGMRYPDNTVRPVQLPPSPGGIGSSYVIAKGDHVRIIARKEVDPEIKGDFLLMREGTADDDLVFIYGEEGKLQLEAKEIFFGKATTKAEPYIRWTVYRDQINELKRQINALADQVKGMADAYSQAFTTSQTVPFSPVASLAAAGPAVKAIVDPAIQNIKTTVDSIDPEAVKSRKLFGE